MTKSQLAEFIRKQKSFLCVGLDTDLAKIPPFLLNYPDPVFEFNKRVIDFTKEFCIAYKPNIAFYEALGPTGWHSLEKTLAYVPSTHFTIADAKRGDIGNTSRLYAKTFFETFDFDAVTVAPYMGIDSVKPFLEFNQKWVIVLALTSNPGSKDFQFFHDAEGMKLYEQVIRKVQTWGSDEQIMFVVGATQADHLQYIRNIVPNHFLLVPGVGKQGGDLKAVYEFGANPQTGLLVNSSRGIIYAGGTEENFQLGVQKAAESIQQEMEMLLNG